MEMMAQRHLYTLVQGRWPTTGSPEELCNGPWRTGTPQVVLTLGHAMTLSDSKAKHKSRRYSSAHTLCYRISENRHGLEKSLEKSSGNISISEHEQQ